jgi:diguanylate cyclase (GGDEF)-like protein
VIDIIEMFIILPSLIKNLVVYRREHADSDVSVGMDAEIYLFIGFIIMMVMSLIEIGTKPSVKVDESVYISHTGLFTSINFLELGMLFFIMCHFIYYFMNSVNHISANRIKEQLEGLAYTDALTELKNRAALSQFFGSLRGNFGIVSIDLDRLKYVNDNMGHMAGDRMLIAFAYILKRAFAPADIIARTGGDEFLVVFQNSNELLCKKCVDAMSQEMAKYNEMNDEFTLSASVGFAFNHEVKGGRYQDVFYLADQRMYKMKEAHHG